MFGVRSAARICLNPVVCWLAAAQVADMKDAMYVYAVPAEHNGISVICALVRLASEEVSG